MLRISKLADYGTIVMVYLAKRAPVLCNARDIALHTHLTVPTVSKLLKRLASAGLLSSMRGVTGGYRLQRVAEDISLADILFALDEYHGLTECSSQSKACVLQDVCQLQGHWRFISQSIESALASVSLATLIQPVLSTIDVACISPLAARVSGVSHA